MCRRLRSRIVPALSSSFIIRHGFECVRRSSGLQPHFESPNIPNHESRSISDLAKKVKKVLSTLS